MKVTGEDPLAPPPHYHQVNQHWSLYFTAPMISAIHFSLNGRRKKFWHIFLESQSLSKHTIFHAPRRGGICKKLLSIIVITVTWDFYYYYYYFFIFLLLKRINLSYQI